MSEPTQSELAALAARLATGEESTVEEYHWLAVRALKLWIGAGEALRIHLDEQETAEHYANLPADYAFRDAGLEPPKLKRSFTLDEALKLLMPGKPPADRMKAFRDYLTQTGFMVLFCGLDPDEADEIPVEDQIERIRKSGLPYDLLMVMAHDFLLWLKKDAKHKRAKAGRIGGKAGKGLKRKATPATKKRGR